MRVTAWEWPQPHTLFERTRKVLEQYDPFNEECRLEEHPEEGVPPFAYRYAEITVSGVTYGYHFFKHHEGPLYLDAIPALSLMCGQQLAAVSSIDEKSLGTIGRYEVVLAERAARLRLAAITEDRMPTQKDARATQRAIPVPTGRGITFLCPDGTRVSYTDNGLGGWRDGQRPLLRQAVADRIGVDASYVDAVEEMWWVGRAAQEARIRVDTHNPAWHAGWEAAMTEQSRGRHGQLRRWRMNVQRHDAQAPRDLRDVRYLQRWQGEESPARVYFLVRDEKVVYVGMTTQVWPLRIMDHIKEGSKRFDDVWFLDVDKESVATVEQHFINQLQPEYNVAGNRQKHPVACLHCGRTSCQQEACRTAESMLTDCSGDLARLVRDGNRKRLNAS